jgi:phage terminase large subunit-like protein
VRGKVPAGKYHRLACERHIRDLELSRTRRFPFRFDKDKAQEAIDFFPKLKHYKGKRWKDQPFELAPWQMFCVGSVFGWLEKKTGLRRFDSAYMEVPKKNGKTMLAAGIGLKQGFFDQEPASEVYSIATMRDQARLSWDDAHQIVKSNRYLSRRIKAYRGASVLTNESNASKFQPLGRDRDSADGKNPYCVIADELHRHKDDELINVMRESMAARDEPLMVEITTAGVGRESVGWKHHKYGMEILEGIQENNSRFVFIAGADEEDKDNWKDEAIWEKANPSWDISVKPQQIRKAAVEAAAMPSKLNDFLRYHLDIWVEQHSVWIPSEMWAACRPRRPLVELVGERCYVGLDLGHTEDLSALVLAFRGQDDTGEFYDIFPFFWIPEPTVLKRTRKDKIPYDVWVRQGFILTTPRPVTDQDFIKNAILKFISDGYDVAQVWYDPSEATKISLELEDAVGNEEFMVKCLQYPRSLHEATRKVEELVATKNLRHGENPVLRWMNNNVDIRTDSEGHIKIDKEKSSEKVDGMVALVMALKGWIYHQREQPDDPFVYDDEEKRPNGFITL